MFIWEPSRWHFCFFTSASDAFMSKSSSSFYLLHQRGLKNRWSSWEVSRTTRNLTFVAFSSSSKFHFGASSLRFCILCLPVTLQSRGFYLPLNIIRSRSTVVAFKLHAPGSIPSVSKIFSEIRDNSHSFLMLMRLIDGALLS